MTKYYHIGFMTNMAIQNKKKHIFKIGNDPPPPFGSKFEKFNLLNKQDGIFSIFLEL